MFSGRRSASTAAEKGETLANCSNSIGKESIVHSYWSRIIQSLLSFILMKYFVLLRQHSYAIKNQ